MEKIAKYELREVLGRGGMGVVYRAYDPLMDREVAIKIILEKALESSDTKARFVREARTAGKLSHENIMVIHDLGEFDGKTYIVMEFLLGKDLRSILDSKESLTLRQKLDYARQICRGLHYAHANLIIHRDIKPENIKILKDGRVKIMDFGIAKPYIPIGQTGEIDTEQVLTRVGMRIGTPWYMSPEQVKGTRVDKRTDIFSFGVVLYELLTNTKPFEGDYTTVMYKILHEEPKPVKLEGSGLTIGLQRILTKCLAKEPDERYADCLLVLRDLDAISDKGLEAKTVNELIKVGEDLAADDRIAEATTIFEEILEIEPGNEQARTILESLNVQGTESATLRALTGKLVGETVSHFRILDKLGAGGGGMVYKAEDITLKRTVALKFLPPELTREQSSKRRFLKEAQAASALDHPNICTIYEISETDNGLTFICMAYYGEEDLGKRISKGPLEFLEALTIAMGVAQGLAKAHENRIVHRDIKPANVLLTQDGGVKIADFGIARLYGGTRITKIGSAMGTLPYMSPEQIKGLDVDHHTDIWSFGVLLYESLTAKLPFKGEYEAAVQHSIISEEPVPPSNLRKSLPAGLEDLIKKALKKDVVERYASMNELLVDLGKIHEKISRPTVLEIARTAELSRLVENGKIYLQKKEYEEALSRFEAALRLAPGDRKILELRAESTKGLGEVQQMEGLIREAKSLTEKGKFAEAEEKLQSVLAQNPQESEAQELLNALRKRIDQLEGVDKLMSDAEFYTRRGKFEDAATSYRKILEADPGHKDAARLLKKAEKEKEHKTKKEIARTPIPALGSSSKRTIMIIGAVVIALGGVGVWLLLRSPGTPDATHLPTVETDSSVVVAVPREEMLAQKSLAAKADARRWASGALDSAERAESRAEQDLAARRFTAARGGYVTAGTYYRRAIDEAKGNEAAANATPSELHTVVMNIREEMLKEKVAAEKTGGKTLAAESYNIALAQEHAADKRMQSGKKDDLLAANVAYSTARERYKQARIDAAAVLQLREDADTGRRAVVLAKQNVSGTDLEKRGSPSYKKAVEADDAGQRLYKKGDYRGARDIFQQAIRQYAEAATEIRTSRAPVNPPVESKKPETTETEKKPPARDEKAERKAAEDAISRMIASYKDYIEQGNMQGLTALLNLNTESQKTWSDFFGASEDRKLEIEESKIDVNSGDARVSFKVKMSFLNTAANTKQTPVFTRIWTLQQDNGAWKMVTQK